jgi:predicted solute-binding protein
MTTTTIATKDGTVKIDSALFQGYTDEAFEYLEAIADAQTKFKEVVETVAETTGLKKPIVAKYLKARFEQKTKDAKDLGNLYSALDAAVGAE